MVFSEITMQHYSRLWEPQQLLVYLKSTKSFLLIYTVCLRNADLISFCYVQILCGEEEVFDEMM